MKIILLFAAALTMAGCSTPFHEFYQPTAPAIVDRSIEPLPTPTKVADKTLIQVDEEKEVQTFPIDLDRN